MKGAAVRQPRSNYRLQITAGFGWAVAAALIGYLSRLGADWVYLSPLLAGRAHGAGMGVLVDIVPSHVGITSPAVSRWRWDVDGGGRDSR